MRSAVVAVACRLRRMAVGIVLVTTPLSRSDAQRAPAPERLIPDEPSCDSCALHLDHELTLRSPVDAAGPDDLSKVARDSRGRFFVSIGAPYAKTAILVFAPNGAHLRTLGGPGLALGQFESIITLQVGPGDSLHVIEANGRHSVVDPELAVTRVSTSDLANVRSGVALADGGLVIHAEIPTPELVGLPLHRLNPSGTLLRSFGDQGARVLPGRFWTGFRVLASSRIREEIWVGRVNTYELQRWSVDGRLHEVVRRSADWFEPWEIEPKNAPFSNPPLPKLLNVVSRPDGRILTRVSVADDTWRTVAEEDSRGLLTDPRWQHVSFDTILELLDVERAEVLARVRTDQAFAGFVDPDRIFRFARENGDRMAVEVWRIRIIN